MRTTCIPAFAGLLWAAVLCAAVPTQLNRRSGPGFQNGDFESGKIKPWQIERLSGAEGIPKWCTQIVSPGYNSQYALQLKPEPQYDMVFIDQNFNAPPNTNYTISMMYKVLESADPSTCTVELTIDDLYHTDYGAIAKAPMVVGDWQPLTVAYPSWNPPDGFGEVHMRVYVRCATGTVQIDNLTFTPGETLESPTCSVDSVVEGGDFESGSVASWVSPSFNYTTVASPGADGSAYALAMSFPAGTQYASDWLKTQEINVCFNYYYTIEFDLNWVDYGPPSNACSFSLLAEFCNVPYELDAVVWPAEPGWTHYSYDCLVTRDIIAAQFEVGCNDQAPTQAWSIQLDNVAVKYKGGPAPAPTTTPIPTGTPAPVNSAGRKRTDQIAKPRWS